MPVVTAFVALVGTFAGAAAAGAVGFGIGALAVGGVVYGGYRLSQIDFNKRKRERRNEPQDTIIYPVNEVVQSPIAPQRVVVGRVTMKGVIAFADSTGPYITKLYLLANHEIDDVEALVIDEVAYKTDAWGYVNDPPFLQTVYLDTVNGKDRFEERNYLRCSVRHGFNDQRADRLLRHRHSEVSSTFRQIGHATAAVEFFGGTVETAEQREWRQRHQIPGEREVVWGSSSIPPDPAFVVRGLKCYDPRTGVTEWTRNGALILREIMLRKSLIRGLDASDIDEETVKRAADICDEGFEIQPNATYPRGAIFKKGTIDGVIQTSEPLINVLEGMLLSTRTTIGWSRSKYEINAFERKPVVRVITDKHIIGNIRFSLKRKLQDKVGTVRAKYTEDSMPGQLLDAPVRTVEAGGQPPQASDLTLDLSYTKNTYRAQFIMQQVLNELQLEKRLQVRVDKTMGDLDHGDVVQFDLKRAPLVNGIYSIDEVDISSDAVVYEWALSEWDNEKIDDWTPGDESFDGQAHVQRPISVAANVIEQILRGIPPTPEE